MVSSSPGLIAASHVLRRLSKPRHSPYALLTCRKDARARYGVLKEFIAPRNPPAYEFACDSWFPRSFVRREGSLLQSCTGCPTLSERPSAWSRLAYRSTRPRCRHARRHARCGSPPRRRSLRQKLNSQWFTWCLRVSRRTDADDGTA